MPHQVRALSVSAKTYVASSSRYINSRVINYSENRHITFETYKRRKNITSEFDQWTEITKVYEYRPDLVSVEIYGSPDFWWRLMEYNGMKDILEFKAGINIRIPGDVL